MGNLKDIQDITGLTSEAIFNIRKPVDYMCSDIDSHIKDIRTQCDYIMDGDEEDVKYYSKVIIYQFTPLPTNNHKLYKYYLC